MNLPDWTQVLLLLSPFVLVRLGLRLAARSGLGPQVPLLERLALLAPVVAVSAGAAMALDPGAMAAMASVPWLIFTATVALVGTNRLLSRTTLLDPGIGTDAGLIFLVVGGAWLTISRAGLNPLGFSDAIVQLTAVHFHYAGFALPIVAGFSAGYLRRTVLVPAAVIVGVPFTAVGITAGGWTEWVAASFMATAGLATAALLLKLSSQVAGAARWLTTVAGVALLGGMALAFGWSWSMRFGWEFLGLESMAAAHGSLNALGFGLIGLVGLSLIEVPAASPTRVQGDRAMLYAGRPTQDVLARLAADAVASEPTNAQGLVNRPETDGFNHKVWRREIQPVPGLGDGFDAAAEGIRQWAGHRAAGIRRSPETPAVELGQTLAVAIPVGPFAISATCRIVDVIDEPDRYGFVYSTLPHHPEDGEESFIVTRGAGGEVAIVVTAVWRPAAVMNNVIPPLTRFMQNNTIGKYLDGIAAYQPEPLTAISPC